jgi:hypothetical protein
VEKDVVETLLPLRGFFFLPVTIDTSSGMNAPEGVRE